MDEADDVRFLEGRYRLGPVIGRGGMGTVWRAHDELLDRDVAIKEVVCPPHLSDGEQQAARDHALREARLAARLRHPNVVGIYDIVEEHGRPWIVMELFPHRTLRDILKEGGPLPPPEVARLGLGILAGLGAAHAEGIVHQDVKPGNILVGPGGRAVLTDFGIARTADSDSLTSEMLVGSPSYIAPERAWGGQAGPASDLWALGATLYTALEGRAPFERSDLLASLTAAVTDEPEPAINAGPLWPAISGLLHKDPEMRLGPAEAERLLSQAAEESDAWPQQPPVATALGALGTAARSLGWPQWHSRRALGSVAATLALATVAATAFALPRGDSGGHSAIDYAAGTTPSAAASPSAATPSSHTPATPPSAPSAPVGGRRGQGGKQPGHALLTDSAGTTLSVSHGRPHATHEKHGHEPSGEHGHKPGHGGHS